MKKSGFMLAVLAVFVLSMPAAAEIRTVHRASQAGGTGMMLMRTGDQLDYQEMNASIFGEYMAFDEKLPLYPERVAAGKGPMVEDPRDAEAWTVLTFNYGINEVMEAGIRLPFVFASDMRDDGIGRIGADLRFLLLDVNRFGAGISSTFWVDTPSFVEDNSSEDVNGGGELNFTLRGEALTDYFPIPGIDRWFLEPMAVHVTMGWGYEDYLYFEEFKNNPGVNNPEAPDFEGTEVIYASGGIEYEVYDRTSIGGELLARQYPDHRNDNNIIVVAPEISYTYKDRFTVQAAYGTNIRENVEDQPEWLAKVGFTYHFPEFVKGPEAGRATPRRPQDILDVFAPSRKPVPAPTEEEEIELE